MVPPQRASLAADRDGNRARARLSLLLLLVLLAAWCLRWTTGLRSDGMAVIVRGPGQTGVVAALTLLLLWGLALTSLLASSRRDLRVGQALTDAAVAFGTTGLLVYGHVWFSAGDMRLAYVPIFLPLALLALLDAGLLLWSSDPGPEVAVIRAGAGLIAAAALFVDRAWLPAALALWLGASPLLLLRLPGERASGRGFFGLLLVAALAALAAPDLSARLVPGRESQGLYEGWYLWSLASVGLVLVALHGLWRPDVGSPVSPR